MESSQHRDELSLTRECLQTTDSGLLLVPLGVDRWAEVMRFWWHTLWSLSGLSSSDAALSQRRKHTSSFLVVEFVWQSLVKCNQVLPLFLSCNFKARLKMCTLKPPNYENLNMFLRPLSELAKNEMCSFLFFIFRKFTNKILDFMTQSGFLSSNLKCFCGCCEQRPKWAAADHFLHFAFDFWGGKIKRSLVGMRDL